MVQYRSWVKQEVLNIEEMKLLIYVDMGLYVWGDLNIVFMETKIQKMKFRQRLNITAVYKQNSLFATCSSFRGK